ncbi:PRC-barrel domain-containing protein [Georgenia sp. MJ170]|uniref:PRC-barrel domain-containing protein n=1 Tax=Georgenia sunbinii TaxID=3117728 RepID=UPI002F25F7FE
MSENEVRELLEAGGVVRGPDGERIGKVGDVYLDNAGGRPAWVTVRTGLLGTGEHFVPLDGATIADAALRVPFDKLTVLAAPSVAADALLSPHDEVELYSHYGLAVRAPGEPEAPGLGSPPPADVRPPGLAEYPDGAPVEATRAT